MQSTPSLFVSVVNIHLQIPHQEYVGSSYMIDPPWSSYMKEL